jgi:heme/copper-type cytochrome/quinol oxidase subunit 1
MTREMIKAQYLIMGGFFFVLGYGLHFYLRWCPTVVSTEHLWLEFIHGTIMVFFGIVPAAFLGLSYHVITPVRGSQMFFPQLDRIALFLFYPSALLILIARNSSICAP